MAVIEGREGPWAWLLQITPVTPYSMAITTVIEGVMSMPRTRERQGDQFIEAIMAHDHDHDDLWQSDHDSCHGRDSPIGHEYILFFKNKSSKSDICYILVR